jgi:hypothetical protein
MTGFQYDTRQFPCGHLRISPLAHGRVDGVTLHLHTVASALSDPTGHAETTSSPMEVVFVEHKEHAHQQCNFY